MTSTLLTPPAIEPVSLAEAKAWLRVEHDVDLQAFVPDLANSALIFAPWSVPQPGRAAAGIELDVTVGYGDAAVDVPEPLRQAIRLLTAHWYENRGLLSTAPNVSVLPGTVARRRPSTVSPICPA